MSSSAAPVACCSSARVVVVTLLIAWSLVVVGCAGCGGAVAPESDEDRAGKVVKDFVRALSERRVDDAVAYCLPEAAETVRTGMDSFADKAIELILSKAIGEAARANVPELMKQTFEKYGVIRGARVKTVTITAPGQATAEAVLIVPAIFHLANIRLQEVVEEKVGDDGKVVEDIPSALMFCSIPLVQRGEAGEWKVASFDPLSMLETTACPNYLVHRFLELAATETFEEEFYSLFIGKATSGPAAEFDLRQDVKDLLLSWNQRNHEVLTEAMVPMMEATGKAIEEGKLPVPEKDLELFKERYKDGQEMLDTLIEFLKGWKFQVLSDEYQVRETVYQGAPDEARHTMVRTVARMPSFMPHRVGQYRIFEKNIRELPLEFVCVRLPDGSWRVANNPFDLKINFRMGLDRAVPSENLRDFED